jgi:multicomponent Na+:H+ antiporter subunit E
MNVIGGNESRRGVYMGYALSLTVAMAVLWLALSGHYDSTLLLSLGAGSAVFATALSWRLHILDGETAPYHKLWRFIIYWPWLIGEIIKANIIVIRTILAPDMVLTPRMVRVKTQPRTELGRALFANSITLTPGTVSIDLDDNEVIVHAILKELTGKDGFAKMAEMCAKACGEKEDVA